MSRKELVLWHYKKYYSVIRRILKEAKKEPSKKMPMADFRSEITSQKKLYEGYKELSATWLFDLKRRPFSAEIL